MEAEQIEKVLDEMDMLKDEKAQLDFEIKQLNDKLKQIKGLIDDRSTLLVGLLTENKVKEMQIKNYAFGLKEVKRKALDQKLLKEKYPQQFNDCYIEKTKEDFFFDIL